MKTLQDSKISGEGSVHSSISWIRWLATLCGLIALGGLITLFIQNAHADTTGFQPGARPFNNPYAPPPGTVPGGSAPSQPFFEDDEDDFEDEYSQPSGDGTASGGGNEGGGRIRGGNGGSIQVEGSQKGVIEGGKSAGLKPINVDDEGMEGGNEVITDFNFPDADILDIAKALGKLTGKSFIYDKDVKGRITIVSNGPIKVKDAWRAFLTALDMNNFALIPSGKFIRIARGRDARDKQLPTFTGKSAPTSDALITRVFSLKYLSAEEVARNFRSFMPANSRIIPYEQTNTVIVTDTGSNIAKLQKLLTILDVEGYDAGIEVVPVKWASATALSDLIDKLLPGSNAGVGSTSRFPGAGGGGGRFTARKTKEGGIINTIIADERTNNLIIHANAKGAEQVRELVAKLDKKLISSVGGGKVHVIYLQFADSEQISTTLNNLTSQSGGSSGGASARTPIFGGAGAGAGTGVNPIQQTLFEGSIKVAPDKSTNSLVVTASPADFVTVQRVVNRLDIPRDQVYAECVIMELTLGDEFNFSANLISPVNGIGAMTNASDLGSFIASPLALSGAILGFKSKNSQSFTGPDGKTYSVGNIQGLIRLLQTHNNANIVATPQILTLDNTEATFESGEQIPVATTNTSNGNVSGGITKENVALNLKIKPAINKVSNFVKLEIDAKIQDFSSRAVAQSVANQGGQATTNRSAKTTVVVADGDTVVIGGLVRDKAQESVHKVPVLGDIPVLGWLFKSKESQSTKTNMLIFITPKIIRQYEAIRAILDRKLKERDEFVEETVGGKDLGAKYRDDIIRSLPDLDKLTKTHPKSNFTIDAAREDDLNNTPTNPVPHDNGNGNVNSNNPGSMIPQGYDPSMGPPPGFVNPYSPPGGDIPPPPVFEGGSG